MCAASFSVLHLPLQGMEDSNKEKGMEEHNDGDSHLDSLSDEMLLHLFNFLPAEDVVAPGRVSQLFRGIICGKGGVIEKRKAEREIILKFCNGNLLQQLEPADLVKMAKKVASLERNPSVPSSHMISEEQFTKAKLSALFAIIIFEKDIHTKQQYIQELNKFWDEMPKEISDNLAKDRR